jgi:hypothetical protein
MSACFNYSIIVIIRAFLWLFINSHKEFRQWALSIFCGFIVFLFLNWNKLFNFFIDLKGRYGIKIQKMQKKNAVKSESPCTLVSHPPSSLPQENSARWLLTAHRGILSTSRDHLCSLVLSVIPLTVLFFFTSSFLYWKSLIKIQ